MSAKRQDISILEETLITVNHIGYKNTISGLRMLRYDTSFSKNIEPIIIAEVCSYYDLHDRSELFPKNMRTQNTDAVSIYCALMRRYTNISLTKFRSRINKDRSVISRYVKRVLAANPEYPSDVGIYNAFQTIDMKIKQFISNENK